MAKDEHKVIFFSVIAALLIWIMDAAFGSFFSHRGTFPGLLLHVSSHEFAVRLFFILSFIIFGVIISKILSRHNQVEKALRKHLAAMEASMDGMAIFNQNDEYVYVNHAYARINGYDRPGELVGKTYRILYAEKELEKIDHSIVPMLQKKGRWRGELTARRKDGSAYDQEVSIALIEEGGRVCIIHDVTEKKRREEKQQRSEKFLTMIFDSIRDPFSIVDHNYRIIKVNEAYAQMRNKPINDLLGKKCHEVLQNSCSVCENCVVEKTFHSSDPCAKDKLLTFPDGSEAWVEIYTYPILNKTGKVSYVIEYTRDITDRRKSETERKHLIEKLEYLSTTDSLTGLLNRRALIEMLRREMDRASRYGSELSLILCDIDKFKKINDTYGHSAGDKALQIVSETIRNSLRKADIVGRHGGDEFMIIAPETAIEGTKNLAEKIRASIEKIEFQVTEQKKIKFSLSMGVTVFGPTGGDIDTLVTRADNALYASKEAGRNKVSILMPPVSAEQAK